MTINLNKLQYNQPLISRDILNEELNDYEIFRQYIGKDFKINEVINSPFRKDNIPSFGIFKNSSGQLIYNDFVLGGGDCYTFVKYLFKYKTWWEVYSRIAIDFWLDSLYRCKSEMKTTKDRKRIQYYEAPKVHHKNIEINVKIRKWNNDDKKYWSKYHIPLDILKSYKVFPIEYIFFKSDKKEKTFKADKIAYCYIEVKDGKKTYKIYQPYSKYKWINNNDNSVWQGWNNIPEYGEILIITKSLKDVMSIKNATNIPAVALQNEKIKPKNSVIEELKSRFDNIFLLYDNDFDKEQNWGQIFAQEISDIYKLKNILIPTEYKSKDFSDLIMNFGRIKADSILNELLLNKVFLKEDNTVPY